jgi:flagellar biosynthesis/type III secretory pathway chaperone
MTHLPALNPQQILDVLDEQLRQAERLVGLLGEEEQALLSGNAEILAELVSLKRGAAESLERASLALRQGTGEHPEQVIAALGGAPALRWQRLGELAASLRRQNLVNGALLNERQNRLRWITERAGCEAPGLYAPKALWQSSTSGRTLARV